MLLRAIFAAVLHIATTLQATYNHLIISASVYKTLDVATEHGPEFIASVGRAVQRTPLKLLGSPRMLALSSNLSNAANVYPVDMIFVFDSGNHTTTTAPTTAATIAMSGDVRCLSIVAEVSTTDVVEVVFAEPPHSASGDLIPYDEEYARQQKRNSSIWANIDWDFIVTELAELIAFGAVSWLYKKVITSGTTPQELAEGESFVELFADPDPATSTSTSGPSPSTLATPKTTLRRLNAPRSPMPDLAARAKDILALSDSHMPYSEDSIYSINTTSQLSNTLHVSTAPKDASAADPVERSMLSGSEDCVEAPFTNGTAPSTYTTHPIEHTPSAVVDASSSQQVEPQHGADTVEASDTTVVAPSLITHQQLDTPVNGPVTALVEQVLPAGHVDTGAHTCDDEALPAPQGRVELAYTQSAEFSNSDGCFEEGTLPDETPACQALDSDVSITVTSQLATAPEEPCPTGATAAYSTSEIISADTLAGDSLEERKDVDLEDAAADVLTVVTAIIDHAGTEEPLIESDGNESNGEAEVDQSDIEESVRGDRDQEDVDDSVTDVLSDEEDEEEFDYAKEAARMAQESSEGVQDGIAKAIEDPIALQEPVGDDEDDDDDDDDEEFVYPGAVAESEQDEGYAAPSSASPEAALTPSAAVSADASMEAIKQEDNIVFAMHTPPAKSSSDSVTPSAPSEALPEASSSTGTPVAKPTARKEGSQLKADTPAFRPAKARSESSTPANTSIWDSQHAPRDARREELPTLQSDVHDGSVQSSPVPIPVYISSDDVNFSNSAPKHHGPHLSFRCGPAQPSAPHWLPSPSGPYEFPHPFAQGPSLSSASGPFPPAYNGPFPPYGHVFPPAHSGPPASRYGAPPPGAGPSPPSWNSFPPPLHNGTPHPSYGPPRPPYGPPHRPLHNGQPHLPYNGNRPRGPNGPGPSLHPTDHRNMPKPSLLERISSPPPSSPCANSRAPAEQPIAGPSRLPSPPFTPQKQTDALDLVDKSKKLQAGSQHSPEDPDMRKVIAIQCFRLHVARMRQEQSYGRRKVAIECCDCERQLPDKCECDLARVAPSIADAERFLEGTKSVGAEDGCPPAEFPLLRAQGCAESEMWIQHKAEEFMRADLSQLPEVRRPILEYLSEHKPDSDARVLLSNTLIPASLFTSHRSETTRPDDVKKAVGKKRKVFDRARVTQTHDLNASFSIFTLLQNRQQPLPPAKQPIAGPSRYPLSPPPIPETQQIGALDSAGDLQRFSTESKGKAFGLKHKVVSIQAVRLFVARRRLNEAHPLGRRDHCPVCKRELPHKCKCDLQKWAPTIDEAERYLQKVGWPEESDQLVGNSGCEKAEAWLEEKAMGYSDEVVRRMPHARRPLSRFLKNRYPAVRPFLSEQLVPAHLFFSFQPGQITPPGEVDTATKDSVLKASRTVQVHGKTSKFTIYALLQCRTNNKRNARDNRRR